MEKLEKKKAAEEAKKAAVAEKNAAKAAAKAAKDALKAEVLLSLSIVFCALCGRVIMAGASACDTISDVPIVSYTIQKTCIPRVFFYLLNASL